MSRIGYNITPHHRGMCFCPEFLPPVKTWKEIAERHASYTLMYRYFSHLTEDYREDWDIDLFRCRDCGRYWVREDCGSIGKFYFFYFVGTDEPEKLLIQACERPVLHHLMKREHEDYKTLIKPYLA